MIKLTRPVCPHPAALDSRNYKHPLNKDALRLASYDKCMYCESKVSHIDFAHVEHLKPKAADRYPHLEFVWDNLGYACPKCNNEKGDKYHDLHPYIDPYQEDPRDYFFAAGTFLFVKGGSERAELTIMDIKLNRADLVERRLERIQEIQRALNACHRTQNPALRSVLLDELQKEADNDKEYSFFVRALLDAHAA